MKKSGKFFYFCVAINESLSKIKHTVLKNLLLLFFIAFGLGASAQKKSKPKAKPVSGAFSIQIQGKLADNCHQSPGLFFGEFNGSENDTKAINVNANGEFTAKFAVKEPGLVYIKKGSSTQYFIVTAKEKQYKIALSCNNDVLNALEINNSKENKTYQDFLTLRKSFIGNIDGFRAKNLDDALVFQEFTQQLREYQKGTMLLAKQNPQTYTAAQLIASDVVSEKDLSSIQNLRLNYLKRAAFGDSKFYNSPLPTTILEIYTDFITDKNDPSFAAFEWILNAASKNTEAAKRLQNILYDVIFKSKRQDLINGYINWAKAHPDKMMQLVVQSKLQRLSRCMVGGPFINLTLKDTVGNSRQLKDVVAASKYTLLIIYSPGCWHCQQTLPKLIPIWEQYKSKGLKVYTVAPNSDTNEWHTFIKQSTGIGWVNVMEEQNNITFGEYVITTLPSFILIDTQGKIVSKMDAETVLTGIQKWFN